MAHPCVHSACRHPDAAVPAPKGSQLPGGTLGRRGSWQLPSRKLPRELGQKQELRAGGSWRVTLTGRGTEHKGFGSRGNGTGPALHHLGWIRAAHHHPGLEAGGGQRGQAVTPGDMASGTPRYPQGSGSWCRHPHGDRGCPPPTRCKPCGHQLSLDLERDQRGSGSSAKDPKH